MFAVSAVLANATREGAALASRDLTATASSVAQRVCDETGWTAFGDACPTDLVVSYTTDPAGDIARVDSTYTLRLLTGRVTALFYDGAQWQPWRPTPFASPYPSTMPVRIEVRYPIAGSAVVIGRFFPGATSATTTMDAHP